MKNLAKMLIIMSLLASPAAAFDLGGAVKGLTGVAKDADCANQALAIVKDGGEKALAVFAQIEAGTPVTVPSLKNNQKLIDNTTRYVTNGCAKSHLEKALATISAATAN